MVMFVWLHVSIAAQNKKQKKKVVECAKKASTTAKNCSSLSDGRQSDAHDLQNIESYVRHSTLYGFAPMYTQDLLMYKQEFLAF